MLLELALLVLVLEGVFVFRPAVRGLRAHLAARDAAERSLAASEAETARLARELLRIGDREQIRLAQDLHDGVSQHLVGVSFLVRALRGKLAASTAAASATAQLDEITGLLDEAIEQTRGIARGLHTATLETAGLAAALRELAVHTERVFGVPCRVNDRAAGDPTGGIAIADRTHLHRIAREAVVNAAKHAGASRIDVDIARDADDLVITVRDDGIGIAPRAGGGLGLHLMAYRARMIRGTLHIARGPAGGTEVVCRVPLTPAGAP